MNLFIAMILFLTLLSWQQAWAQNNSTPTASTALEEIIVTAQKRDELLSETPLSVTAWDADELGRRNVTSLGDLASGQLPSLRITPFANSPATLSIGMRGIQVTDAGSIGLEAPVGINIDGVYLGRMQGLIADMLNIERLEVLRGPQGTLYGRNNIAGVVNLISTKPSGEFGIKQVLTIGSEYGELRSLSHIDLPSYNGLAARITYLDRNYDGYIENRTYPGVRNNEDFSRNDQSAYRVALRWQSNRATLDYAYDDGTIENTQGYLQASNGVERVGLSQAFTHYCGLPNDGDHLSMNDFGNFGNPNPGNIAVCGGLLQAIATTNTLTQMLASQGASIGQNPLAGPGRLSGAANNYIVGVAQGVRQAVMQNPNLSPDPIALSTQWIVPYVTANATEQNERADQVRSPQYLNDNNIDQIGHTFLATVEFDHLTLKSITSMREIDQTLNNNFNGALTGMGISSSAGDNGEVVAQEQLSQEIQVLGDFMDGQLQFVSGFYYFDEEARENQGAFHTVYRHFLLSTPQYALSVQPLQQQPQLLATAIIGSNGDAIIAGTNIFPYDFVLPLLGNNNLPTALASPYCLSCRTPNGIRNNDNPTEASRFNSRVQFEATSQAVFGQVTYRFNPQWDVSLGLRYTQDERIGRQTVSNALAVANSATIDDNRTDYSLAGRWRLSDQHNLYLRYATGYKAGGISQRSVAFNVFEEETLANTEIGYKGRLAGDSMAVNVAFFTMDYDNKQISPRENIFRLDATPANIVTTNIPGTTNITGLEAEFSIIPFHGLTVKWDMSFIDWDVPTIAHPNRLPPCVQLGQRCTLTLPQRPSSLPQFPSQFYLDGAPNYAGSLSFDYILPDTTFGVFDFHIDFSVSGDYHPTPTDAKVEGYTIVNSRIALSDVSLSDFGEIKVALWGKNITNESYHLSSVGAANFYNPPATYGLDVVYQY